MKIDFSVYKLDSDLEVIYEESRSYKDPYKFFQEDPEINILRVETNNLRKERYNEKQ